MAERSSTQTPTTRTRRRRSSTPSNCLSRSILAGCFTDGTVNVAEARKEIANALQLHRSGNNNNTSVAATKNDYGGGGATSNAASAVSNVCSCCGGCRCVANCTSSTLVHHPQYCDFSSAASMNKQLPVCSYLLQPNNYLVSQPVWSTTSPSVFPTPSFVTTATDHSAGDVVYNICDEQQQQEDQVIDWGDKLADSSYTWWFGFLKSLDGSGGGGTNGVLVSNNGADHQISMQQKQQQEIHREDQNLSSHEHHDEWLIEPEAASN